MATAHVPLKDTTVKKVRSLFSPKGPRGQVYLVSGKHLSMRLWHESPLVPQSPTRRNYETVGYVVEGRARLEIEGQTVLLEPGDSWLVPAHAEHRYEILESFVAVEATAPPSQIHSRDD